MDTSAFSIIPHRGLRISIAAKQAAANPDPTFDANFQVGTIIWTVVNAALALLMTARIIYVSIKRHQLSYSQGEVTSQHRTLIAKIFKKNQWNTCLWRGFKITTEDVFPLLLATMIAIQEIIYLYAETRDIDGRKEMMPGCKQVTEVVWGGAFLFHPWHLHEVPETDFLTNISRVGHANACSGVFTGVSCHVFCKAWFPASKPQYSYFLHFKHNCVDRSYMHRSEALQNR